MLSSKARWTSQGEHQTRYFLGLEKRNAKSKIMSSTINRLGDITRDPKEILNLQRDFHAKLYSIDESVKSEIKTQIDVHLSEDQRNIIEQNITLEDIKDSIKHIARGKSPGSDGFGIGIYIVFFERIKHLLLHVYNFAHDSGTLHS